MSTPAIRRLRDFSSHDVLAQRMGEGGFGLVYMGPDLLYAGKWRALKTLRPELVARAPQLQQLFLDEGLTWVGLWPHANVLNAQAVTQIDGALYLVLEYAENGNLRELLSLDQPFATRYAWAQMVAAGLLALHTPDPEFLRPHPLVHRDLKPENVLVDDHGYAKITDFGLATKVEQALRDDPLALDLIAAASLSPDSEPMQSGVTQLAERSTMATRTMRYTARDRNGRKRRGGLGTVAYMPPEQWNDDQSGVGTPADIYAFGLILSELLAGRHGLLDFEAAVAAALLAAGGDEEKYKEAYEEVWYQAHAHGTPRALRGGPAEGASRLPKEVEQLYAACLAKRAKDRPTAEEALRILQRAAEKVDARPYMAQESIPRSQENRRIRWHNWAVACANFDRYEEALKRNDQALKLAPRDSGVLLTRANVLGDLGLERRREGKRAEGKRLMEEALACYTRSLAETPDDDLAERNRIYCSWAATLSQMASASQTERDESEALRRYAEADPMYEEALRLMTDDAVTWRNRGINVALWASAEAASGRSGEARERFEQARTCLQEARRYSPNDDTLLALLASVQQEMARLSR